MSRLPGRSRGCRRVPMRRSLRRRLRTGRATRGSDPGARFASTKSTSGPIPCATDGSSRAIVGAGDHSPSATLISLLRVDDGSNVLPTTRSGTDAPVGVVAIHRFAYRDMKIAQRLCSSATSFGAFGMRPLVAVGAAFPTSGVRPYVDTGRPFTVITPSVPAVMARMSGSERIWRSCCGLNGLSVLWRHTSHVHP